MITPMMNKTQKIEIFFPNEEGSGVSGPNEGAVPKLSGNSLSANFVLPGSHLQMKGYIYSSTCNRARGEISE